MHKARRPCVAQRLGLSVGLVAAGLCSLVSISCSPADYALSWERTMPSVCMCVDVDNTGTVLAGMWSLGAQLIDPDGETMWTYGGDPDTFCTGATMSPDGKYIAVTDTACRFRLLTRDGEVVEDRTLEEAEYITRPHMSDNGELVVLSMDGSPCVMTVQGDVVFGPTEAGELVEGRHACVTAISADGACVVAACAPDSLFSGFATDFNVYLLDSQGNLLWKHEVEWMPQTKIGISATGDTIAVPVGDKILVLDRSGKLLSRIQTGVLGEAAVSASGAQIVSVHCSSADGPGSVRVTNSYGNIIWQWESAWKCGDQSPAVAISPNAEYLVVAIKDRVVAFRKKP